MLTNAKKNNQEDYVALKIRLKRFGTKKRPYYRIVVMDSRAARDSETIEEVGLYHPIEAQDKQIVLKTDRIKEWLSKGAQVSDTVRSLLNKKQVYIK
jgi:small subunit ribosomal protein S16